MNEIVCREIKRWSETLEELNEFDITVVNILLKHYSELIEAGGTAGGKRANKFAEYINEKKGKCDKNLEAVQLELRTDNKRIKRLKKLEVDSFRGFSVSRTFDLGKQYIFLYGPNGSGKSSFSEALEYSLLGIVEEADANKIKLSNYIKNTTTKKGKKPIITCLYDDDTEGVAIVDYASYRFAFVEKNRIADFSHISVLNNKSQNERIAALFGLSAFNEFVQGFTTNFDGKYLAISSVTEKLFEDKKISRNARENQLLETKKELDKTNELLKNELNKLNKKEITNVDDALDYLDNSTNGILTLKIAEREKQHAATIPVETIECFCCQIIELQQAFQLLRDNRAKLSNMALQVNYKNLYEIISGLDETDNCPVCGTELQIAKRNPYKYAKEQLQAFSEIEVIQKKIDDIAQSIRSKMCDIKDFLSKNQEFVELLMIQTEDIMLVELEDIRMFGDGVRRWLVFCEDIMRLDKTVVRNKIEKHNMMAVKINSEYQNQITELTNIRESLITLRTQIHEKEEIIKIGEKEIREFDQQSKETIEKIQEEKRICEFNLKIIEAYNKIIGNLISYNRDLPMQIAQDLEKKVIDYYNIINQDDADFEKLKELILPDATSDKMYITFADGSKSEALQVLSEGHVKILGLSILLAKAVHDNLEFIIFDDIVNAIDDDHRNGVADLLMNHLDFRNIQIILSTHGDQFISKLQDKLGAVRAKNNAIVYKFMPADSLEERGVIVEYSDAKSPLMAAEDKYNKNEIKDAASKCRQAMECLSYNLWNLIAKSDGMISVGMRNPKSLPDLSSIVDGLIKKTGKIQGMDDINKELKQLREAANWRILNKGTHYEDEQKEFERADVKCVYDHLVKLDELIKNSKISNVLEIK